MPSLYMLPFDHRGSFQKMILGHKNPLSNAEREILIHYKNIIFDGFKQVAEKRGVDDLGILVDEEFGEEIHREAHRMGVRNAMSVERSGQPEFEFEYDDWRDHLRNIQPYYAKALVRVTMGEDHSTQNQRLAELARFCADEEYQFLLEPLIFPSDADLAQCGGDKKRFDLELRPQRFAEAVEEFHNAGVHPDVWKIEGTDTAAAMEICAQAVMTGGKPDPEIIILGRGESAEKVEDWLRASAKVSGVTGFAVGRTIFAESLQKLYAEEISEAEAIAEIAQWYEHFIDVFESARG